MNVAYMDAWRWRQEGATRARLRVDGGMRPGRAANVIAELPGTDPGAGVIYVGAHHDTQAGTPGADDNGSGTVILLETARLVHTWYHKHHVLGEPEPIRSARLALARAAQVTLANGLAMLGITAPERM